jgi:hypothetical protein
MLVGHHFPTSRESQENIYASPYEKWYSGSISESPPCKSLSPATTNLARSISTRKWVRWVVTAVIPKSIPGIPSEKLQKRLWLGAWNMSVVQDSHSHAQAAQAAHVRSVKQLKLKRDLAWPTSPTKARAEPYWSCLLKDPVAYMTHYNYSMARTNRNLTWDITPSATQTKAVRKRPNFPQNM